MFNAMAYEIENKTKNYWKVSLVWNSRSDEELLTGEAIKMCTDNLKVCNPTRPVAFFTRKLLGELIQGEGSPRPEDTSVIAFPDLFCALNT